jgi:hypothetical protein
MRGVSSFGLDWSGRVGHKKIKQNQKKKTSRTFKENEPATGDRWIEA